MHEEQRMGGKYVVEEHATSAHPEALGRCRMLCQRRIHTWLSKPSIRGGMQSCFGMILALATMSTPAVWNALSENEVAISPVYALVTYNVVLQATLGAAVFFILQRLGAATIGSGLGLALMYITFGLNGSSYEGSVTKAVVMCVFLVFFAGFLLYFQQVYPRYVFGFMVAQLTMAIVALTGYHVPFQPLAMPYLLLQMVLGVSFAAVASIFFFPILAGKEVEKKTRQCISKLGAGTEFLVKEILLERRGDTEVNFEIEAKDPVTIFYDSFALKASQNLVSAKNLINRVVATEVNIYGQSHIFPRRDYGTLLSLLRHYLSILMTTLYFFEDGNNEMQEKEVFEPFLVPLAESMHQCFDNLASVLDLHASFASAIECLENLESRLSAISDHFAEQSKRILCQGKIVTPTVLLNLYVLALRLRRCYLVLPSILEAYKTNEEGIWDLCYTHFESKSFHLKEIITETDGESLLETLQSHSSSASSDDFNVSLKHSPSTSLEIDHFMVTKQSFKHPNSPIIVIRGRAWFEKIGIKPTFLKIAIQQMVALLCGTIIHVCDASYNALGGHTIWIIFTIVVIGVQESFGGLLLKGWNRILGTLAGGAAGMIVIYLVYFLNGMSYSNRPSKFIMMTIVASVINGYFMSRGMKARPQFYYAWVVMKITFPITCFVGYTDTEPSPEIVGYRLLSVLIGFMIELIVSAVIFSRNTSSDTRHRIQEIFQKMALLSQETSHLMLYSQFTSTEPHQLPLYVTQDAKRSTSLSRAKSWAARRAALGELVIQIKPIGIDIGHMIESLKNLELILDFEDKMQKTLKVPLFKNPFASNTNMHPGVVRDLGRKLRRLLNEFLTLAYLKDSMELDEITALRKFRKEIDTILSTSIPESLSCISLSLSHSKRNSQCIDSLNLLKAQFSSLVQEVVSALANEPGTSSFEDQIVTCSTLKVLGASVSCIQDLFDTCSNMQ